MIPKHEKANLDDLVDPVQVSLDDRRLALELHQLVVLETLQVRQELRQQHLLRQESFNLELVTPELSNLKKSFKGGEEYFKARYDQRRSFQ